MVIYLIGLMGAGKSTIGAALASELGYSFHDTDTLIEQRCGLSVAEIFARKGEASFRSEEATLINDLVGQQMVISCGGGLPFYNGLMEVLLKRGTVVYLHASPETLLLRLHPDDRTRPLLGEPEKRKEVIRRQYEQRNPVYMRAEIRVDIHNKSVGELIAEIRDQLS